MAGQIPIIKAARRRKYFFDSRQDATERFMAGKGMFKTWAKPFIQVYLDSALDFTQTPGRLRRHPDTEAQFFSAMLDNAWGPCATHKMPGFTSEGSEFTCLHSGCRPSIVRQDSKLPAGDHTGPTHFLPMEKPDLVASAILDHLI